MKLNKIIIAAFLAGLTTAVFSQKDEELVYKKPEVPVDQTTNKITYTKVVETAGTKDDLYKKATTWFNTYYNNPSEVVREKDPEAGKIIGKGRLKILNPPDKKGVQTMKGIVMYTFTTEFKEGRLKYTLTDINLKAQSYYACETWLDSESKTWSQVYNYFLQQVHDQVSETLASFEKHMTSAATEANDDW
ncbi:MAG: DUF4468 domain-containing protein [Bacteroidota bacterium]